MDGLDRIKVGGWYNWVLIPDTIVKELLCQLMENFFGSSFLNHVDWNIDLANKLP